MNRRALAAVCLAALAAVAILRGGKSQVELGKPAPAFRLAGLAGQAVSLGDYKGKVVLVNFWASWCPDCREEFPALEALYRKHRGSGFEVLAPSVDNDGRKAVLPFIAKAAPTFTILLADPKTAEAYGVHALPASFLIAPDGSVIKRYLGAVPVAELENDIVTQLPRRHS